MPIRGVLFDLDGTLLDTLADVARAANAALRDYGFPEHSLGEYRQLLGGGVQRLFAAALPPEACSAAQIARCVAAFRAHYARNWNDTTRPYGGIPELLRDLSRRGLQLAVLSNKPHDFTRECIAAHFAGVADQAGGSAVTSPAIAPASAVCSAAEPDCGPIGPFAMVVGERPGCPVKPDPAGALQIAAALEIDPGEMLYVGDTSIDMQTARRAGMRPIGALWGFRSRDELEAAGAEALLVRPADLLELLA